MKIKHSGFTLIELMITVAIIGILAGIAYPSYSSYILKSRRADAKAGLVTLQMAQEKYRVNNASYADDATLVTPDGTYYAFAVTAGSATGTGYTITATPQSAGGQNGDVCATLSINETSSITSSAGTSCPAP